MTVKEIYSTANRMARRFNSPWIEDSIQDAVIAAWKISQEGHTKSYINSNIFYTISNSLTNYGKRQGPLLDESSLTVYDTHYSLPLQGFERIVAEKMIETNFQLDSVAFLTGYTKSWVSRVWKRARVKLQEVYS
jgi:hypothetical protein